MAYQVITDRSKLCLNCLFILEAVRIWINLERKERRTLHHNGDGTFTVESRTINLQERMVLWKHFQD